MSTKFTCLALLSLAPGLRATPVDDAIAAAMNLSSTPNYAWTATINQNGHSAEIRGKTSDSGYSVITFVGFAGSRAGRGTGGGSDTSATTNAVFLSNDHCVVETAQGWVAPTDPAVVAEEPDTSSRTASRSGGRAGTGGARGGRGGTGRGGGGTGGQRGRTAGGAQTAPAATGPRLPTAINPPADELAIMVTNNSGLHFENGILNGKLTPTGADLLFAPGSTQRPPEAAGGTFRIWIKDGAVTQYELKLTADSQPGGARGSFAETITVNLKDVGSTRFEVPTAAKKKLGI